MKSIYDSDLSPESDLRIRDLGHNGYALQIIDFKLRHPLLYLLGFKSWFIRGLPVEDREHILARLKTDACVNKLLYKYRFVNYHPILFILWSVFQFTVKQLSAPIKKISSTERSRLRAESADKRAVDNKLTQENHDVPAN